MKQLIHMLLFSSLMSCGDTSLVQEENTIKHPATSINALNISVKYPPYDFEDDCYLAQESFLNVVTGEGKVTYGCKSRDGNDFQEVRETKIITLDEVQQKELTRALNALDFENMIDYYREERLTADGTPLNINFYFHGGEKHIRADPSSTIGSDRLARVLVLLHHHGFLGRVGFQ